MNAQANGTFVVDESKKVICKAIDKETAKEIADMYKHMDYTKPPKYSTVDNHLFLIKWSSLFIFTLIMFILLVGILLGQLSTGFIAAALIFSGIANAINYALADVVMYK